MRVSIWAYLLQQTACTWCLLLALGTLMGVKGNNSLRSLAVALMASVVTLLTLWVRLPWLRLFSLLVLTACAPLLSFPSIPPRLRVRASLAAASLSLLLAGWGRLLSTFFLSGPTAVALCCAALLILPRLARWQNAGPHVSTVEICLGDKRVRLTALVDSGNLLRDTLTGLPVIVISRRSAGKLMPLPGAGEICPGMRLLSVRTIAGTTLMPVFRPELVRLQCGGSWRAARALIGLSPDGYDGFQALVPAMLLNAGEKRNAAGESFSQGG